MCLTKLEWQTDQEELGVVLGKGVIRPVMPEHWLDREKCHQEEASGLGD